MRENIRYVIAKHGRHITPSGMGSPRIEGILDLQARRFKCH
jgi:hypothetical protein